MRKIGLLLLTLFALLLACGPASTPAPAGGTGGGGTGGGATCSGDFFVPEGQSVQKCGLTISVDGGHIAVAGVQLTVTREQNLLINQYEQVEGGGYRLSVGYYEAPSSVHPSGWACYIEPLQARPSMVPRARFCPRPCRVRGTTPPYLCPSLTPLFLQLPHTFLIHLRKNPRPSNL